MIKDMPVKAACNKFMVLLKNLENLTKALLMCWAMQQTLMENALTSVNKENYIFHAAAHIQTTFVNVHNLFRNRNVGRCYLNYGSQVKKLAIFK